MATSQRMTGWPSSSAIMINMVSLRSIVASSSHSGFIMMSLRRLRPGGVDRPGRFMQFMSLIETLRRGPGRCNQWENFVGRTKLDFVLEVLVGVGLPIVDLGARISLGSSTRSIVGRARLPKAHGGCSRTHIIVKAPVDRRSPSFTLVAHELVDEVL